MTGSGVFCLASTPIVYVLFVIFSFCCWLFVFLVSLYTGVWSSSGAVKVPKIWRGPTGSMSSFRTAKSVALFCSALEGGSSFYDFLSSRGEMPPLYIEGPMKRAMVNMNWMSMYTAMTTLSQCSPWVNKSSALCVAEGQGQCPIQGDSWGPDIPDVMLNRTARPSVQYVLHFSE